MTTTWMAGVLAGAALICTAHPSPAQDKAKIEAAELARASRAALQQLYATAVPLAKELDRRRMPFWSPEGHEGRGFEVGFGPSVVLVDEGMAKTTTTTLKDDIYAFVFGRKGLMAGLMCTSGRLAR